MASFPEPAVGSGARLSLTPSGSPQLGDIHTSEKPKVKKRGNSAPIYWQTMKQSADGKMDSEEIVPGISMRTGGTVSPVVKLANSRLPTGIPQTGLSAIVAKPGTGLMPTCSMFRGGFKPDPDGVFREDRGGPLLGEWCHKWPRVLGWSTYVRRSHVSVGGT